MTGPVVLANRAPPLHAVIRWSNAERGRPDTAGLRERHGVAREAAPVRWLTPAVQKVENGQARCAFCPATEEDCEGRNGGKQDLK